MYFEYNIFLKKGLNIKLNALIWKDQNIYQHMLDTFSAAVYCFLMKIIWVLNQIYFSNKLKLQPQDLFIAYSIDREVNILCVFSKCEKERS